MEWLSGSLWGDKGLVMKKQVLVVVVLLGG